MAKLPGKHFLHADSYSPTHSLTYLLAYSKAFRQDHRFTVKYYFRLIGAFLNTAAYTIAHMIDLSFSYFVLFQLHKSGQEFNSQIYSQLILEQNVVIAYKVINTSCTAMLLYRLYQYTIIS